MPVPELIANVELGGGEAGEYGDPGTASLHEMLSPRLVNTTSAATGQPLSIVELAGITISIVVEMLAVRSGVHSVEASDVVSEVLCFVV